MRPLQKRLLTPGLLLATFSAWAQQQIPGPLEGANVIAVLLADSGAVARQHVTKVLEKLEYQVQSCNAKTGQLTTTARQIAGCYTSIQVLLLGHTVLLSGEVRCELRYYRPESASYSSKSQVLVGNFDCYKWCWNELARVAEELHGVKTVSFRRP